MKVLPVSWFHGLRRILSKVEENGVWPGGLLDAYIAMIPKTDGCYTLGQRPLSVLPVIYRIGPLLGWGMFQSWVADSVFGAGGGRSSVEAWYTAALDTEEVHSGVVDSDIHLFVADVIKSFDTGIVDKVSVV